MTEEERNKQARKALESAINAGPFVQIDASELAQLRAENAALWAKLEALQQEYDELEQQAAQLQDRAAYDTEPP